MYSVCLHWTERGVEEATRWLSPPKIDAWAHTLEDALTVALVSLQACGATIWDHDLLVAVWVRDATERGTAWYFHGRAPG
jgi:hypothetical protein